MGERENESKARQRGEFQKERGTVGKEKRRNQEPAGARGKNGEGGKGTEKAEGAKDWEGKGRGSTGDVHEEAGDVAKTAEVHASAE